MCDTIVLTFLLFTDATTYILHKTRGKMGNDFYEMQNVVASMKPPLKSTC